MEEVMQSNTFFIVPLSLAYITICALWFLLEKKGWSWGVTSISSPKKAGLDFGLSLLAVLTVFLIGRLYSAGYLISSSGIKSLNLIIWPLNNILIFSPIFIILAIRKQSLSTVFISSNQFLLKVGFGLITSAIGILLFLFLRDEIERLPEIVQHSSKMKTLSNFPAIFLENIALAFLFVRLKWAIGTKWAIAIPSILFAFAHIPGSIAEGDPFAHIITFFFVTGSLTTAILYTAYRSRDIIWLGVVHYLMDVVIKAF